MLAVPSAGVTGEVVAMILLVRDLLAPAATLRVTHG
jgi:hypothetical protein